MRSPILITVLIVLASAGLVGASELVPLGPPVTLAGDPWPGDELVRSGVAATAVEGGFSVVWHEFGYEFDHVSAVDLSALGIIRGVSSIYEWYPRSLGLPSCPTVATLGRDRVVVAWTLREYSPFIIAFRRYSAAGTPIDGAVRVVREPLGVVFTADCPAAAGNEDGAFALAWNAGLSPYRAQAQGFHPTGERATPILELATASGKSGPPALGLDRSGRIFLAADDLVGAVWGERFSATGAPLGGPFRIGRGGGEVALAPVPSGGFLVAWSRAEAGGRQILLRHYGANGRPLELPRAVSRTKRFDRPALRVDRQGRPVLFWIDENRHLVGRLFEADLAPAGGLTDLGAVGSTHVWRERVGLALLGRRLLAVWLGPALEGSGNPPLLGQLLDIRP